MTKTKAGMTKTKAGMTKDKAGMTKTKAGMTKDKARVTKQTVQFEHLQTSQGQINRGLTPWQSAWPVSQWPRAGAGAER